MGFTNEDLPLLNYRTLSTNNLGRAFCSQIMLPQRYRDEIREVWGGTGGDGCLSIQWSVGSNRPPWYRLADTQAYGLDVWYAGSLLASFSLSR